MAEQRANLGDQAAALRLRDSIRKFAVDEIGPVQPRGKMGRVVKVDNPGLKASVWFPGDDAPVDVNLLTHVIPWEADINHANAVSDSLSGRGARVWVEDINSKLYITAILSPNETLRLKDKSMETGYYFQNPAFGTPGQAFALQSGSVVSFVVPNPPQDDCIVFGPFGNGNAGAHTEISIFDMRFGGAKTYRYGGLAEFSAAFVADTWYKLAPNVLNPQVDIASDKGDFDLEIGNAPFISKWDGLTYNLMAFRIRRKNDNNAGAANEADGYRVIIRSNLGMTGLQAEPEGFFPFQTFVDSAATEPTLCYGANQYSTTLSMPNSGPYPAPQIDVVRRYQELLTFDGAVTWDGTNFKFTGSFKILGTGRHPHTLQTGEATISMPAVSSTVLVIGDTTVNSLNVSASGIALSAGQALYYNTKVGGSSTTDDTRWIIVEKEKDSLLAPHWVMIAVNTGGTPALKLGDGSYRNESDGWQQGVPGWFASTNPAIGNGQMADRYKRRDSELDFWIALVMGSTTTFGVGQWSFSLPVAPVDPGAPFDNFAPIGQFLALDASASAWYRGQILRNTGNAIIMQTSASGTTSVTMSATSPFTWTTGDKLTLFGRVEVPPL